MTKRTQSYSPPLNAPYVLNNQHPQWYLSGTVAHLEASDQDRELPSNSFINNHVMPSCRLCIGVVSSGCGKLAGIDLDAAEWASFAAGIAALARERERKPHDFDTFLQLGPAPGPGHES